MVHTKRYHLLYRLLLALVLPFSIMSISAVSVRAQTSGSGSFYTEADVESYIAKWAHRDGAAGSMISDEFCRMVTIDPDVFLSVMSKHNGVFQEWMKELPELSFTDWGGCVDLEAKRRDMISALQRMKPDCRYGGQRAKLLKALMKMKIHKID